MPQIKLQHIVSCSSEDKNYSAENLLKGDGFKKWRGAATGEKQVSVALQFEKASKIHQIDIGNDGSAFIEVLVGKSSSASDDFQVILVASAFMTPLDSRAVKNTTSVRMFTAEKLSKAVTDQKWDKVKVVCTQPFNKTTQYGLAFIKFHSPPEEGSTGPTTTQSKLGAFKLKTEEGDGFKAGALFSNRDKEKIPQAKVTGAAAVRAASKLAEDAQMSVAMETQRSDAKETLTLQRETSQVKRKHDSSSAHGSSKRQSMERRHSEEHVTPLRKQSTSISSVASSITGSGSKKPKDPHPLLKKTKSEPTKSSHNVAFNKLMRKVVFVMSGYQNPERAKLRDKAMEMGAEYRPDWGKGCTHLICAFENTPKYNQIKGKGRIVEKDWIRGSYKAKKLLPWRQFRVGRARSPVDGSSDSGSDTDTDIAVTKPSKTQHTKSPSRHDSRESKPPLTQQASDPYGGNTDSGDDTEDEIRRVREADRPSIQRHTPKKSPAKNNDVYDVSTDDEVGNGTANGVAMETDDSGLPDLPDIFHRKKFFFYGKFSQSVRRRMLRFIIAYNGSLEDYMTDNVSYVLTDSDWDKNFDQALTDNPSIAFIRPDWLFSCDEHQKYMPHQRYAVIPK